MTTSLHRRFPAWVSSDPDNAPLLPCVASMHFTTARPLEIRIRVPLALAFPDHADQGTWAVWPCDRLMLKSSAWVVGSKFGVGDIRVGMPNGFHWLADLRRRGRPVIVLGTFAPAVRAFVADTERLSPTGDERVDVDAFLAEVLGGAAS
jgi:hypothetical protein